MCCYDLSPPPVQTTERKISVTKSKNKGRTQNPGLGNMVTSGWMGFPGVADICERYTCRDTWVILLQKLVEMNCRFVTCNPQFQESEDHDGEGFRFI